MIRVRVQRSAPRRVRLHAMGRAVRRPGRAGPGLRYSLSAAALQPGGLASQRAARPRSGVAVAVAVAAPPSTAPASQPASQPADSQLSSLSSQPSSRAPSQAVDTQPCSQAAARIVPLRRTGQRTADSCVASSVKCDAVCVTRVPVTRIILLCLR